MAHYFNLEQAEALLPYVAEKLRQVVHTKSELGAVTGELEGLARKAAMTGGLTIDRRRVLGWRNRREALARSLRELIEEIHALGCQIKDLDAGLLDFPTLFRGREVLLCWKFGEQGISYWHGLEEGFRGRREIDRDFLENHEGQSPA